ncbi:hypothetical protein MKJ04_14280 [Pontibacter sp. E15-1]|uniref:hypothetical protein n=1 Tax=Pontibacter sp. E15-1 TaxID=2919918 RepID=UPI001F4F332B|nr:hypothetical protein [Pontibacter sp. E15-1]MCJ8166011.1 hypothetical protein [Pontibacter sp. E15-1]
MSQDQFSEITTLIQQARSNALSAVNTELINSVLAGGGVHQQADCHRQLGRENG